MVWNIVEADSHESKVVYINFKMIAVLLVLAAAICGGVHYWHTLQVARHTPLVLEVAKKKFEAKEYASSLAYYETYLGYRPNDADAIADHALLKAALATNAQTAAEAFYALRRALNVAPARDGLAREYVKLGVRLNRVGECAEELDRLLRQSPDDPEVLLLGARGALQLRQFDKARPRYELVLNTPVADKSVYLELIQLLSNELKDQASADELMVRLLERYPAAADVHAAAAVYYFQRGKLDLADAELALAMGDQTLVSATLLRLQGQIARARRRPLELEASLSKLVELSAGDHRAEFELAELESSLGRRVAAIQRLKRLGRDENVSIEHLWQVIMLLDAAGAVGEASEFRVRLTERDREGAYVDSLAMRDRMIREDWKGAIEISRPLINRTNVSPRFLATVWQWRADCCEKTGDLEGMLVALRRTVAAMSEDLTARNRLAQLLFQMGRFAEAQSEYATLIQRSPVYAGEFVSLLQQAAQGQTKQPLGRSEIDNLFQRWRSAMPGQPLPVLSQLDFYRRMQDQPQADRLIEEGLRQWPQEAGFHLARISNQRQAGDWTAAFASLDAADAACGLQAPLLVQRILSLEQSAPGDLRQLMEACAESFLQLNRDSQVTVWPFLLSGLQRAQADPQRIAELQKMYSVNNPTDLRMLLFEVESAAAAGDLEAAQRHRETIRTTAGEQSPAYRIAAVLCELRSGMRGDRDAYAKAQDHLTALLASPGDFHAIASSLQADLYLLQKRPREALRHLQTAMQAGDQRLSTLIRTLGLIVDDGRLDQTIELLKNLPNVDGSNSATSMTGPNARLDDVLPKDRSLTSFREALTPAAEESWAIALVVYRIDLELDERDRSMEQIQRALELGPREPIVWANWLALLERQQSERLDAELAKARKNLSLVDQGRLLPGLLIRHRRANDAKALLEAARREAPADPILFASWVGLLRLASKQQAARDRLEKLLQETLADNREEMKACRDIARRELALYRSASNDYRDYLEAIQLADELVQESNGANEESLALQAEIYSKHVGHWQSALEAYRKLQSASAPQRQFDAFSAQARIHERRRRWEEERAALESCRTLAPDDPAILLRLLSNAVRRKDTQSAESLNAEIHAGTKDRGLLLHADVLSASLSKDRAKIVARIQAAYHDGQASRDTVQEWLTLLKAFDPLQAILKAELNAERVETISRYVQVLAQNEKMAEAVAQLSELWKSGRHEAAMAIAAALTTSTANVTPADLEPLRASTAKLAASEDAPLRVLAAAAALEDFAGNHPAAVELYRRIVAKDPNNVIALNNLAFLVAVSASAPEVKQLTAIERVLQTVGPIDQLLDTKGMLLLRQGDAAAAAKCFEDAWNQRGETTHLLHLAWAYSELGQADDAQQCFRLADATDPPVRLHPLERPLDAAWRTKSAAANAAEQQSAGLTP